MSFVKYRVKEVATDFGISPKEVTEIIGKFMEKPKSYSQVLTDAELNVVFEHMTQKNQIKDQSVIFNQKPTTNRAESKPAAPQQQARPQGNRPQGGNQFQNRNQNNNAPRPQAQQPQQAAPVKQPEPERKRERRVVDTSAVQVNANRFADVDNLVSERVQNFQGGKQRIGGGKGGKQQKQQQKSNFKGNKSRNEE